ncbi:MAG: O-acetylhomoserine aminocarboxypropyltransferase/cysteine synthase family protein [Syntrophothermus sp.]
MSGQEFKAQGFDTIAVHGGQAPDPATGARAVPIYQSTSFVFQDAAHAARLFALEEAGNIYTRLGNPTHAVFEARMAALEGAEAGIATSSGMAAITTAIFALLGAGDEIVSTSRIYGGTYHLFADTLPRLGIKTNFVEPSDLDAWRNAITGRTKLFYVETPGNPSGNIIDIRAVSTIAHQAGIPVMVDNTFNTPYIQRPLEFGADIVVHSATKFIGGHGTSIGGIILGTEEFIFNVRAGVYRDMGPALSPFNSWLFLQGLETLSLRMERHCANAMAVARFLEGHPLVNWVAYPGLESHPDHQLARRQMRLFGSIFTFGVKGGLEAGRRLIDNVRLCSLLANVGDAKTLIIHPASTTHQQLSADQQESAGVTPDMIRLSVGLEDSGDIIADLDRALKTAVREAV